MDECDKPVAIIRLEDGGFKFYPLDIDAISGFLEFERERILQKDENYCGAV